MERNAGEIVKLAVKRQNLNITELSKRLNVNRRTLYNWFGRKKLDTTIISAIGKAIDYDFSIDFGVELNCASQKEAFSSPKKKDPSDHPYTVKYWMEKYIALLEEYKNLAKKHES